MLSLHGLKNVPGSRHRKRRVGSGRGSGRGKTCGRGQGGQYARSGHKHKPGFEGGQMRLIRRVPKRGFTQARKNVYDVVQVSCLDRFEKESEVTPAVLRDSGLVKGNLAVKILGGGELKKKLVVKAQAFSQSARRQITEAGGACEVVA